MVSGARADEQTIDRNPIPGLTLVERIELVGSDVTRVDSIPKVRRVDWLDGLEWEYEESIWKLDDREPYDWSRWYVWQAPDESEHTILNVTASGAGRSLRVIIYEGEQSGAIHHKFLVSAT